MNASTKINTRRSERFAGSDRADPNRESVTGRVPGPEVDWLSRANKSSPSLIPASDAIGSWYDVEGIRTLCARPGWSGARPGRERRLAAGSACDRPSPALSRLDQSATSLDFPALRGEVSHGNHDQAEVEAFVRSQTLFNGSVAATDQPRQSTCVSHDGREAEPPEQAVQPREAPELAVEMPAGSA